MADYDIPSTISYSNDGTVSIDAIDAMSEAAAERDLRGFYAIAETYGSSYAGVAIGYKSIDQSLMGKARDLYTAAFARGIFSIHSLVQTLRFPNGQEFQTCMRSMFI